MDATILHFLGDGIYFITAKTLSADIHLITVLTLTPTHKTGVASYAVYSVLPTVFSSLPPHIESPSPLVLAARDPTNHSLA